MSANSRPNNRGNNQTKSSNSSNTTSNLSRNSSTEKFDRILKFFFDHGLIVIEKFCSNFTNLFEVSIKRSKIEIFFSDHKNYEIFDISKLRSSTLLKTQSIN